MTTIDSNQLTQILGGAATEKDSTLYGMTLPQWQSACAGQIKKGKTSPLCGLIGDLSNPELGTEEQRNKAFDIIGEHLGR